MNVLFPHPVGTRPAAAPRLQPAPYISHQEAVARAIAAFRRSTEGLISLTDASDAAGFSRFHFSRVFHRLVGLPPCTFQSLLRLDTARRLLLTTSRSIIEISMDIGYQSLGTFTRRFTETLGLPPLRLRQMARTALASAPQPFEPSPNQREPDNAIGGKVTAPPEFGRGLIFVGLFDSPAPQGYPVRCSVLEEPGPFSLTDVDDGTYYLLAAAFGDDASPAEKLLHQNILRASARQAPLVIQDGRVISGVTELMLRPPAAFDPPILTALLPLMADQQRSTHATSIRSQCDHDLRSESVSAGGMVRVFSRD
jgi:AraC family transcriptional regulator